MLKTVELSMLKTSLFLQARTPDGVRLHKSLQKDIEAAKSSDDLLVALGKSSSFNWLDIRLLSTLARASRVPIASTLITAYKDVVFSKSLTEALPKFSMQDSRKKLYLTKVSIKLDIPVEKITIGDVDKFIGEFEKVKLDLGKGVLNLKNVKKGCLEIQCSIPLQLTFHAYKMALHDRHSVHFPKVICIKINGFPLITGPWYSESEVSSSAHHIFNKLSGEYITIMMCIINMIVILVCVHYHCSEKGTFLFLDSE